MIFDLDGVFVDSEPYWREGFRAAVDHAARAAGLPSPEVSDETLRAYEGGRASDTVAKLVQHEFADEAFSDELLAEAVDRAVAEAVSLMRTRPAPIESNVTAARECAAAGYAIGVASSSPLEFIETVLDVLGLSEAVGAVGSAFELPHAKPHPEVYLDVLSELGAEPHESVAIEDSLTGATAAVRAGIPTLLVNARSASGPADAGALQRSEGGRVRFVERVTLAEIERFAEGAVQ